MAKYDNDHYPVDLSNTPKLIFEMGERFRKEVIDDYDGEKSYSTNQTLASNPVLVCKGVYLMYLTAAREGEILLHPSPKVSLTQIDVRGRMLDVVKVEKLNLKHFSKAVALHPEEKAERGTGGQYLRRELDLTQSTRAIVTQHLPIDNEWENKMWKYIIGRERFDLANTEQVLNFDALGGYEKRSAFSHYIKAHFNTPMTDGNIIYPDDGLTPHQLRHIRVYNMLIEKGWSEVLIQSYLGWSNKDMLEHYVYIQKMLKSQQQLELLKSQINLPGGTLPRYK